MYKALIEIGGYKPGDTVPDDKAEIWIKMYKISPVELTDGRASSIASKIETKEEVEDTVQELGEGLHDDYLARNTGVVKANIKRDDLSVDTLNSLLKSEQENKNRRVIVNAIRHRLREIE